MMSYRLAVVGGGNMGAALVGGLLDAGWAEPSELAVVELVDDRRRVLHEMFPGVAITDSIPACDAALIAVKPNDVAAAAAAAARVGAHRILSIAAGVSVHTLEQACGADVAVVRAMPNTPALVGQAASAICGGTASGEDDLDWAESILGAVGTVVRVPESQLDAVTGLAGSGPAYLFMVAEALIEGGLQVGLERDVAEALVTQLFIGSAALLADRGDPAQLRVMVTSPGGTTAAGLGVLDAREVRDALIEAVAAATARSRELGRTG